MWDPDKKMCHPNESNRKIPQIQQQQLATYCVSNWIEIKWNKTKQNDSYSISKPLQYVLPPNRMYVCKYILASQPEILPNFYKIWIQSINRSIIHSFIHWFSFISFYQHPPHQSNFMTVEIVRMSAIYLLKIIIWYTFTEMLQ